MPWAYTSEYMRTWDKRNYIIVAFMVLTTVYLLGASPGKYFLYWCSILQILLYVKRFVLYLQYGYEYIFVDFCYIATIPQIVFLFICPDSRFLYMLYIGISSLVGIIFLYRMMIVFHDLERTTSCYQHILPFLLFWNIHWNIRGTPERKEWGFYDADQIELNFSTILEYYGIFYLYYFGFFSVIFYTFVLAFWDTIVKYDYCCFAVEMLTYEKGGLHKVYKEKGKIPALFRYLIIHVKGFTVYVTLTLICMYSYYIHNVCMIYMTYLLFSRGGGYYIDYFHKKYPILLQKMDELGPDYDYLNYKGWL